MMCEKMDTDESPGDKDDSYFKLEKLPPDVFIHVCSFLSSKYVVNVLSKVCRKFKYVIDNELIWSERMIEMWSKRYPLVPDPANLDWREACLEREEHYDFWNQYKNDMQLFRIENAHYKCVHCISLLEEGSMCVSGGIEGSLLLWNVSNIRRKKNLYDSSIPCLINSNIRAHRSAILALTYDKSNKTIYTGGFDMNIKAWNLENPSIVVDSYSGSSPVVCLAFSDNLTAGYYRRNVSQFDPRVGLYSVWHHMYHEGPVHCIATDERHVISGSEEIIVYDIRAQKVLKTLNLESTPQAMSYEYGQLLIGDILGYFYVIDPTNGNFDLVHTFKSGHGAGITGIQHTLGSVMTCSGDKTIRIYEPSCKPALFGVLNIGEAVAKISAYKTTLVSGNNDGSITICLPKEEII